ncbi:aminoglycoside phosphotransferase family protein [Minwuia sp.]|uniref:aminoglycoside phosphotransferase family protein n=1 Tax=Minwuia sp. TaxID=2493630 RepID=UPI003A8FCC3F
MEPDRIAARDRLIAEAGLAGAAVGPLAADASFRSYDRIVHPDGRRAVLMNAPPGLEDVRPFHRVADLLSGWGLSAPTVIEADTNAGFLLLEDLGDDLFSRLIAQGHDEVQLYAAAVDVLIALARQAPPADLPAYDMDLLLTEADLMPDWYAPHCGVTLTPGEREAYRHAWRSCLGQVAAVTDTLVLRDYHVDNLIWLPERHDVAQVGLLDFQDAVRGHAAYDLASLLSDVRRDVPPQIEAAMLDRYIAGTACSSERLRTAYTVLAAQRNTKILGIFTRLSARDGKDGYLRWLPRTWRLLERDLRHPALAPVAAWFDNHLPNVPSVESGQSR